MKRNPASLGILALVAAAITSGCAKHQEDTVNSASAQTPAAETPAVEKPRFETLVIPDGTPLVASLDRRLSTETNHDGDPFVAITTEPVIVDGRTVLPAGAQIHGVLRGVQASGRIKGRAQMTLAYQDIVDSQGSTHAISALPLTLQAASATHGDVEKIAAGGVIGALVGGITGGGKGAAIGAGAGASAGTVLMLATKGSDLELEPGRSLTVRPTAPTSIPVLTQK
jgi:hypothetical protein